MSRPFSADHANDQIEAQERNVVIPVSQVYHWLAMFGGVNSPGGSALVHVLLSAGFTPKQGEIEATAEKLGVKLIPPYQPKRIRNRRFVRA